MPRVGQLKPVDDERFTDRIAVGVLTSMFPPALADEGYEEVARLLVGGLGRMARWRGSWRVPTTGALTQARARLGSDALKALASGSRRRPVPQERWGRGGRGCGSWRSTGRCSTCLTRRRTRLVSGDRPVAAVMGL